MAHHLNYWRKQQKSQKQQYVLGGKKCSFFGKFGVLCFFVTSVLRFAFLSYHQWILLAIFLSFENEISHLFNPFHATGLFLYPLKTWENLWVADILMGYIKKPVTRNGFSKWAESNSLIPKLEHWSFLSEDSHSELKKWDFFTLFNIVK